MSEELLTKLKARLLEELNDVINYNNLYEELINSENKEDADIIERIANDEYSHAEAITYILEKHGVCLDETAREKWKSVCIIFDE